ncbi:hypothetical protein P4493_10660 [Bacillus thuringiensis]|uniref:Uncharacterized protein n=3 Tax=Bacillus thuringiensis TaxID=1428 RepID=A0AB35PBN2_BACTU|nr:MULTISPECIES: hypothetical protein [Bacillus]MEC3432571.1 hypothetical protein [Bacillus cereus]AFQ30279.1 hypothetical protein BTF1_30892 [Bacillus thuringiensis HD-789]AJH02561.1 hypothetical protein AS86_6514 [Bacillus thuringiensis HD1002]AND28470.1 hypothetical protein ATN07_32595 [Bacillus thuringiensis serovar israelensis]EEM99315.1 hypothetical protein bthur0014_58210 [Bacillus thuringiensis IBL 4222]
MENKKGSIFQSFTSKQIIWAADLIAVKMKDGTYDVFKGRPSLSKGIVDGLTFKGMLVEAKQPIVLCEDYLDKDKNGRVLFS